MSLLVYRLLLLLLCLFSLSFSHENILQDILTRYELLHASDLRHTLIPIADNNGRSRRRSLRDSLYYNRQIHFYTLGRSFSIHLSPHYKLFHSQFTALSIDHKGHSVKIDVNKDNFHTGHLLGDNSSTVTAHLSQEGVLTAAIKMANETYYIEPAKLHIKGSHDSHMIVYKLSDVNEQSANISHLLFGLDYERVPPHTILLNDKTLSSKQQQKQHLLKKRSSFSSSSDSRSSSSRSSSSRSSSSRSSSSGNVRNSCTLALVADYRFYSFLLSSQNTVITTIVSRIQAVDQFYRSTQWIIDANDNTITDQGFQIGTIIIHTGPTTDPSHYNSEASGQIDIQSLLRRFSRGNWADYCLAHLFTHRRFVTGKLGLAYIASTNSDETGGMCSTRAIDSGSGDIVIYNTGLSVPSSQDRLLLPQEAELVIAHEIGHNWGSPHDPGDDPSCRLRYLMNEFAQDGSMNSHSEFSQCSRRSIGRVLISKSSCFEVLSMSNCGNYMIDSGEECDGGRLTVDNQDPCCDSNCMLRTGKNCSDINHACCLNCAIAPVNSIVCHFVGNVSTDCTIQTHCNGTSSECPPPLSAPEGSTCLQGKCQYVNSSNSIQCVPLCAIYNLQTCTCEGEQRCVECCLNVTGDGTCQPLMSNRNEVTYFPNGVFCGNGICIEGMCVDQVQDFISQLWSVISTFNINRFAILLKENIVSCVCLISLLIWIPGACLFHWLCDVKQIWKKCLPRKRRQEANDGSVFVSQYSWTKGDHFNSSVHKQPLLFKEEEEDFEVIDSNLFQPVEEPEDTMPLPQGYSTTTPYYSNTYSNTSSVSLENSTKL